MDRLERMIKSVGFPVVAFLLLFFFVCTTLRDNTKAIQELTCFLKSSTFAKVERTVYNGNQNISNPARETDADSN